MKLPYCFQSRTKLHVGKNRGFSQEFAKGRVSREQQKSHPRYLLYCPAQFHMCWYLLCVWFASPQKCFLFTIYKYFMILPPPQNVSLLISPLASRDSI